MTMVGGIIGASIGSIWGPIGMKWGWAIGTTLAGLLTMSGGKNLEVGKLSDQSYSGSSYGATFPYVWGEDGIKVGGNIIWVMSYKDGAPVPTGTADSTSMLEHYRESGGGGKGTGGGGGTKEYYYSATYLVAWCVGSWKDCEGNEIVRNHTVKKILANGKVIWEDGATDNLATVTNYAGTWADTRPATLVSVEGTDEVSAHRGLVKSVIALSLETFGNNHVSLQAVIATDAVTDGDIVKDILMMANIKSSDIDVTDGDTPVSGFKIEAKSSPQEQINILSTIFCRDIIEVDGGIKYVSRGKAIVATINKNQLGVVLNSDQPVAALAETFTSFYALPRQVRLTYFNVENDFGADTQERTRQTGDLENKIDITAGIALTPTEAKKIATRVLNLAWAENVTYKFSLDYRYIFLTPGDCINIPVGEDTKRVRILELELGLFGEIRITAVPDYVEIYTQYITSASSTGETIPTPSVAVTDFKVWSGTELKSSHRAHSGFYVAANGPTNWLGANVYYSVDGTEWILAGETASRTAFGTATDLADGAGNDVWDLVSSITGVFDYIPVTPATTTEDAVLNSKNIAVIWNDTSANNANLEVFGYVDVTPSGVKTYDFEHLRRGMLASDYTGHLTNDNIVLVSNGILRVSLGEDFVGDTITIRCVSPGQTVASAAVIAREQTVTIVARVPESIDIGGEVKGGTAHSVLFISNTIKMAQDNPDFTYNAGTNLLSAPNATIATNLTLSNHTSTRVLYAGTAGLVTSDGNLTFSGTVLTALNAVVTTAFTLSGRTAGQVLYTSTAGLVTSGTSLTFDGDTLALANATTSGRGIVVGTSRLYQATATSGSGNTFVSSVLNLYQSNFSLSPSSHTHLSSTESSYEVNRTFSPGAASSGRMRMMNFIATASGSQNLTDNTSALVGVEGAIVNNNTGTVTAATAFIGFFTLGANSTTTRLAGVDIYGGDVSGSAGVGGTVTENFNYLSRGPRSVGNTSVGNVPIHAHLWLRSNTWSGTGHVTAQYGIGHYTWANPMYPITANSQTRIFFDIPEMPAFGAFSSTIIAAIRFQTGVRAKRNGLQWGTDTNANLYSDASNSILTDGKFTCATFKVGTSSVVGQALCATDTTGNVAFTTIVTKRFATVVICAGFTPAATGADVAEIVVPYSPADGTTSLTYNVRRIDFRVNVAGGAPAVTVEKSTASTAFSSTAVGTVTLGSGAYEGNNTTSLGTVASGNKLRMNVGTLGTATGWTVQVLLEAQ